MPAKSMIQNLVERARLRPSREPSLEEIAEIFKRDPIGCFRAHGDTPYNWNERGERTLPLTEVYARCRGVSIAYIHGWGLVGRERCRIRHLGISTDFLRLGIGRALVHALAHELKNRYSVSKIIFAESQRHVGYEPFFKSLGCEYISEKPGETERWTWEPGNTPLV